MYSILYKRHEEDTYHQIKAHTTTARDAVVYMMERSGLLVMATGWCPS